MKISVTTPEQGLSYLEYVEGTAPATAADNSQTNQIGNVANNSGASFESVLSGATATLAQKLNTVYTYQEIFTEAANTYGVDVNLLTAMAKKESEFNPNALSSSGAAGMMQLMPSTASYLGVTDVFDPYQNIMAGAKYISEMLQKYNGNTALALAAYNAGPGNVDRAGGVPSSASNYVNRIQQFMAEGVAVPEGQYINKSASKEVIAQDIQKLLVEFSQHESYDDFVALMREKTGGEFTGIEDIIPNVNGSENSSEALLAYQNMLGTAQSAIDNIIAEG